MGTEGEIETLFTMFSYVGRIREKLKTFSIVACVGKQYFLVYAVSKEATYSFVTDERKSRRSFNPLHC